MRREEGGNSIFCAHDGAYKSSVGLGKAKPGEKRESGKRAARMRVFVCVGERRRRRGVAGRCATRVREALWGFAR